MWMPRRLWGRLAYDSVTNKGELGLRARGGVVGAEAPIVLCAIDWIGLANGGHDAFRDALAQAAGTSANGSRCMRCINMTRRPAISPPNKS